MNETPKQYKLYSMDAPKGNIEIPRVRFSRYAAPYTKIYIFVDTPPTDKRYKLQDEGELDYEDRQWLIKCKNTVNGEHLKANETDYLQAMTEILNQTEELLKQGSNASGRT